MTRLLHLESSRYPVHLLNQLRKAFDVVCFDAKSQKHLSHYLLENEFECIFTRLGLSIDTAIIELQPNLKYIVTPTTGLNHIDLLTTEARGIEVISLKGETDFLNNVRSTAEHTWAILLSLIRNINEACTDVKLGNWRREPFIADELDGKTIGIIGLGRIGRMIASYAKAFNMEVLAFDINLDVFNEVDKKHVIQSSLEDVLRKSHIITLHIPYNSENDRFIDSKKINPMHDGVYIINTSRGEIIDENSLLRGLLSGKVRGAALDVLEGDSGWSVESNRGNKLLEHAKINSNLIITPHMAGYGKVSIERTRQFITEKFLDHFNENE